MLRSTCLEIVELRFPIYIYIYIYIGGKEKTNMVHVIET